MIRPITVFCSILALCAGLYLYRAKHEVELIDKHIDLIAKQTSDLRAESRRLLDDWIRLGAPEQLHKYSDEYLGLRTIAPPQFARLSDLATRLQAPQADPPDEPLETVAQVPDGQPMGIPGTETAAQSGLPAATDIDGLTDVTEDLPVPPIPPPATGPIQTATSQTATSQIVPSPQIVPSQGVIAPPLQARPVTPRLTASPPDPDAPKPRPGDPLRAGDPTRTGDLTRVTEPLRPVDLPRVTDETRNAMPRQAQVTLAGARATVPNTASSAPVSATPVSASPVSASQSWRSNGLPPLQAQPTAQGPQPRISPAVQLSPPPRAQAAAQGLPPLQAPGSPRWQSAPPANALPANAPGHQVFQAQAPAQGGSLLGSHGAVPLPLPAPTPVSDTWSGAGRPIRQGQ